MLIKMFFFFFRVNNPIAPVVAPLAEEPVPEAAEEEVAELVEQLRAAIENPLIPGPILGPDDWAAEELGPALNVDLLLPD